MRKAPWGLVGSSLVALTLIAACNDNKGFKGATATTNAKLPDTENADPVENETPEVVAEVKPDVTPDETEIVPEIETANVFKDCDASSSSPFIADLYQVPDSTKNLPDFSALTAIKKICLKQIDITDRSFTDGFPGVEDLNKFFALNFNFNLKISEEGEYKFRVISDDGSKVFIDDALVIDNDKTQAATSRDGKVTLSPGSHKINVQYFQGPPDRIALELFWTPPGAAESYIPPELVSR